MEHAKANVGPCPNFEEVAVMDSGLFAEVDQLAEEAKKKEKKKTPKARKRKGTESKKIKLDQKDRNLKAKQTSELWMER